MGEGRVGEKSISVSPGLGSDLGGGRGFATSPIFLAACKLISLVLKNQGGDLHAALD